MKTKKSLIRILIISVLTFIGADTISYSHSSGAPAGNSGAPGETECTSCHSGTAAVQIGWITSNIPSGGYIPGTTYTITATASATGRNRFGFEASPKKMSNNLLAGTLIRTSTETQIIGSGRYITHTFSGITGTGSSKSWSFDWTAPAAGSGTVIFYGAFNAANGDNSSYGDLIYTSKLEISESVTTEVVAAAVEERSVICQVDGGLVLDLVLGAGKDVQVQVFNLAGENLGIVMNKQLGAGSYRLPLAMPARCVPGIYIIAVKAGGSVTVKKAIFEN